MPADRPLQIVGNIGSIGDISVSLAGDGVDGGLGAAIREQGFFFCCTTEVGGCLTIRLAHRFLCLRRQLGGCVGSIVIGNLADNGTGSCRFYIDSVIGDFVLRFVDDVSSCQAAVTGYGRSLIAADGSGLVFGDFIDLAAVDCV